MVCSLVLQKSNAEKSNAFHHFIRPVDHDVIPDIYQSLDMDFPIELWCTSPAVGSILNSIVLCLSCLYSTLRQRQNGCLFIDGIFLYENAGIFIQISLKFSPKGPINNKPALVLIMAWHQNDNKPLSESIMV